MPRKREEEKAQGKAQGRTERQAGRDVMTSDAEKRRMEAARETGIRAAMEARAEAAGMAAQDRTPQAMRRAMAAGMAAQAANAGPAQDAEAVGRAAREMERAVYAGGAENEERMPVGQDEAKNAMRTLLDYKAGKKMLETRIIESERWWKLRHWECLRVRKEPGESEPKSAWLFNVIMGKHADAMNAFPEPIILPREEGDRGEAEMLSSIVPVVLEQNDFEAEFSDAMWKKMKQGTGIFGIYWDANRMQGLGDIAIKSIDPLALYWEPGAEDIQESRNVFHVKMVDNDVLEERYPQLRGKLGGREFLMPEYPYDDYVSIENKSILVDWYYKKQNNGRTILHFAKICGENVLYATENDPELRDRGLYDDGQYPFVFDVLFPIEGCLCGYGYVEVCKSPQEDIDRLNQAIVLNALLAARRRYMAREDAGINEEEFLDWKKPIVHVKGGTTEDMIRPMEMPLLNNIYVAIMNNRVEEMKQTSGNQDVMNGATPSGVTAASAIAALQESAGRSSRDAIRSSYRAYRKIIMMAIERIRQFYDAPRTFRILGERGTERFVRFSNAGMAPQSQGVEFGIDMGYRVPAFDVSVRAARENPYTRLAQNELATQMYGLGVFNPQLADQATMMLDMMDFTGKQELVNKIARNGQLMQQLQAWQQMALALAQRYQPEMAEGLASQIAGGAPGAVRTMQAQTRMDRADAQKNPDDGEDANMKRARERSAQAVSPDD